MTTTLASILPLTETLRPVDQPALADAVRKAFAAGTPVYPIGGGTSLDYGTLPTAPGIGLALDGLDRVVDYPARDMTITVEAGIRLAKLAEVLAAERQALPIDVPHAAEATLGGLVATAFSGPRRYGHGTMRDYVIGISAVDGRGTPFKGGGRVVKNVAGYDFCKLLTGSFGAVGVISQVTLKIKPLPETSALAVCDLRDFDTAERLLGALVTSAATPSAIELVTGPQWRDSAALGLAPAGSVARLVVGLEGSADEVHWMISQLADEWRGLGVTASRSVHDAEAKALWHELAEFPASADAPLVVKASVLPSRTIEFIQLVQVIDPAASIAAHAGNGIVIARFAKFEAGDVSRVLIGRLQPAAQLAGGHLVVLSSALGGLTRQAVWGGVPEANPWMQRVKRAFDPKNLLNPGRSIYDGS